MVNKKVVAIIQARYESARFPGKILKKINNTTILEILVRRLKKSKLVNRIVVSCSSNPKDKSIISICNKLNIKYFIGSEKNVLSRYYKTAKKFNAINILRVTADCPFVDSELIDKLIKSFFDGDFDYASNVIDPSFPDGLDIELFKFKILSERYKKSNDQFEKEHVTSRFIKDIKYKTYSLKLKEDYSKLRITLDTKYDLQIIKKLFKYFKYNFFVNYKKILILYKKKPSFFEKNCSVERNSGMKLNKGQKYWVRAKDKIPGGTMLFSKNPDLFLPGKWPAYFSKSKGCKLWDLDNNLFNDISFMGVGTNILGYCQPDVEKKVTKVIKSGNMSTLNSIEEIHLAEKLISLHPWSEMARFTRSGGEANAVAIRIARAASGRDKVAVCGYHGWHDWYLSSNIANTSNLNSHLMKNIPIDGVPKNLINTVFTFEYNNFDQLKKIVEKYKIGTIKMEVKRNSEPKNNFLRNVRKLASKKNIVLIFDECTSGFRQTFGGLHKSYNVEPDIAIFGKALGNGYAINAIIGRRSVMEYAEQSFISSTFWTERIGPTAALETLKVMEKIKSWDQITLLGKKIKKRWANLARLYKLDLKIQGIDALPNFYFNSKYNLMYKTLITQEMLKKKILASNTIYCSIAHKEKILDRYFDILDNSFDKISMIENNKKNISDYLKSEICISGMRNK